MKIKSYYSRSVEDAMASARAELGPEAMLVNSRKAPIQTRHLGEYEVVFATLNPGDPEPDQDLPLPAAAAPQRSFVNDRISSEVADLKKELESMRRMLTRTAFGPQQWTGASTDVSEALATLNAAEVAPELAREIVEAAHSRVEPLRPSHLRAAPRAGVDFDRALSDELRARFTVDSSLGSGKQGTRIAAVAGPPGGGKTTTLVKLAVTYGLAARRPVLLLSMDTYRVGAAEQLRSYAAILGVGFQVLDTVAALAQTIEENRGKELIFIDTPGIGYGEMDDSTGLGQFLATRTDIDTHLVIPASLKPADLTRMIDAFDFVKARRLLFTKLDETGSFGPILSEAARTGKPLSFFTNGQRIPEDFENATQERLLDLVVPVRNGKARAA